MLKVEFDDGKPINSKQDKLKQCTRKGRSHGFYLIHADGQEDKIEIGYMRISEMADLEKLFNDVAEWGSIDLAAKLLK